MTTEQTLQLMVATLTKVNEQQGRQISELTQQVKELTAQIAWFQRQMFGRKSEKNINIDNGPNLFDYNTAGKSDRFGTQDKPNKNVIRTWATTQEKSIQRISRPK